MNKNYDWNIFDAKWNNFKRWVDAFSEDKPEDALMLVSKLKSMVKYVDDTQDKIDDSIIEFMSRK